MWTEILPPSSKVHRGQFEPAIGNPCHDYGAQRRDVNQPPIKHGTIPASERKDNPQHRPMDQVEAIRNESHPLQEANPKQPCSPPVDSDRAEQDCAIEHRDPSVAEYRHHLGAERTLEVHRDHSGKEAGESNTEPASAGANPCSESIQSHQGGNEHSKEERIKPARCQSVAGKERVRVNGEHQHATDRSECNHTHATDDQSPRGQLANKEREQKVELFLDGEGPGCRHRLRSITGGGRDGKVLGKGNVVPQLETVSKHEVPAFALGAERVEQRKNHQVKRKDSQCPANVKHPVVVRCLPVLDQDAADQVTGEHEEQINACPRQAKHRLNRFVSRDVANVVGQNNQQNRHASYAVDLRNAILFHLVIITSLFALPIHAANPVHETNRIDWSYAGVEGRIPYRSTPHISLSSTVTVAQLNAHIAAASSNTYIDLVTAGTYTLSGAPVVMKNGVSLRGQGATTRLAISDAIYIGTSYSRANINILSGSTRGSSAMTLASSPDNFGVGSSFIVSELNDTGYVNPYGNEDEMTPLLCTNCDDPDAGTRVRGQLVRLVSITGADITFTPALYSAFTATPRINYTHPLDPPGVIGQQVYVGLESMTISNTAGGAAVRFEQAQNCWLSNVTVSVNSAAQPNIFGYFSHHIEVKRCTIEGFDGNASGIVIQANNGDWLVEDNIFNRIYQCVILVGRNSGHVIAYNYVYATTNTSTALIGEMGLHGAHPEFILWEGNKGFKFHGDQIHGSGGKITLWRNYFRGARPDTTFGAGSMWIDAWHSDYSVAGCVFGYPGMSGVWGIESTDALSSDHYIYRWGYSGYNPHESFPAARTTMLLHGNYDYVTNGVVWADGVDHDLQASQYLAAKQAWFASLAYPSLGPDTTGYYTNEIPSEFRFRTGGDPVTPTYGRSSSVSGSVLKGATIQ
jgi:hypothetical protein